MNEVIESAERPPTTVQLVPPRPRKMLSVCIISHNAYGAITGGKGYIGGVEHQTSLLAKWLARRGHAVTMLTWDEGGPPEEIVDGVRVIKVCRQDAGIPGFRLFHPKWTGLVAALRRADADVYYHNCAEVETGQIARWCRQHARSFVFSAASEADCDPRLPQIGTCFERALYRYGLRRADRIVVQTRTQQTMMREVFGLASDVVSMPCPAPTVDDDHQLRPILNRVLWVGRVCRVKRPDRLVEISKACPGVHFDLVGPARNGNYVRNVCRDAREVANMTVHGGVPRDRIGAFYQGASLLCCTSDYEGFPNTFLEAWSHGLPVVSTVDPDGVIGREEMGIVSRDVRVLGCAIRALLADPEQHEKYSVNARRYYQQNHTMEAIMPQFERIFADLVASRQKEK